MLQETNQNERALRIKAPSVLIKSLARLICLVFELPFFQVTIS